MVNPLGFPHLSRWMDELMDGCKEMDVRDGSRTAKNR